MKMLDAGAYGIICPMINSREDAELLVAATRYAPRGTRSWGPLRAVLYAGTDYLSGANDTVLNFAMIETAQAVDRIDEICSVEGLDAIYVGPRGPEPVAYRKTAGRHDGGEVGDAIRYILAKAKEHGVFPCTHTSSPQFARKMLDLGFRFVTCSNDSRLITAGGE